MDYYCRSEGDMLFHLQVPDENLYQEYISKLEFKHAQFGKTSEIYRGFFFVDILTKIYFVYFKCNLPINPIILYQKTKPDE